MISEQIDLYGEDTRTVAEKIAEIELQMSALLEALPPLFGRGNRALAANPYHLCVFRRLAAELKMHRAEARGDNDGKLTALCDVVRETTVAIEFAMNDGDFYAWP